MQHERQQSCRYPAAPIAFFQQHFLYFFPEPHEHGSFGPGVRATRSVFCSSSGGTYLLPQACINAVLRSSLSR